MFFWKTALYQGYFAISSVANSGNELISMTIESCAYDGSWETKTPPLMTERANTPFPRQRVVMVKEET